MVRYQAKARRGGQRDNDRTNQRDKEETSHSVTKGNPRGEGGRGRVGGGGGVKAFRFAKS